MNTSKTSIQGFALSLVTAVTLMLGSTALGQETKSDNSKTIADHPTHLGIGVHAGANFNNFTVTAASLTTATNNRTGLIAGVHIEAMSLGLAMLRLELNYSVKGYEVLNLVKVDHRYLQIPILFRFSPIIGPIELFAEIGPAASIHLSSSTTVANSSATFSDHADNFDLSGIVGLGAGIKLKNVLLEIEGRYDYGFTNLSDTAGIEVNSRAIQLIAGLTFLI